jgi:hypothetical protein
MRRLLINFRRCFDETEDTTQLHEKWAAPPGPSVVAHGWSLWPMMKA